jgi:hypothetical protein
MYYYLIRILGAVDENASTEEKLKQIEEMIIPEKRNEMAENAMRNLINSMHKECETLCRCPIVNTGNSVSLSSKRRRTAERRRPS